MFDSKALKDFGDLPKRSKLYLWWIESGVGLWYYWFVRKFITNPLFQILKLYHWQVNVFHNDYDFDAHSIFAILEYKLQRVKKALDTGHAIQEPKDMKALKLAIKLARRLKEDNYEMRFYDKHREKWGELKVWFTPCVNYEGYSESHSSRPNAVTDEEKALERKESTDSYVAAENSRNRDRRCFFDILNKYMRNFWD